MRRRSQTRREDADALLAIGLGEPELEAYEILLARPGSTLAEIAAAADWPLRRAQRAARGLERKGLATRLPEQVARYLPPPPDIAVEALISRRQDELRRARAAAARLRELTLASKEFRDDERVVELLSGREAQARVFEQIQRSARSELLSMERPPYVSDPNRRNEAQEQAMARGVAYRNIIDPAALEIPGRIDHIRALMAAGEQTRVYRGLPMKIVVVDRRVAIVPLRLDRAQDSALLLRPSSLLDALCEFFETLWQRAVPLGAVEAAPPDAAPAPEDSDRLVSLLAAGLTDKVIAAELGISARTFGRRIAELSEHFGARTRFQAGWTAALRLIGRL